MDATAAVEALARSTVPLLAVDDRGAVRAATAGACAALGRGAEALVGGTLDDLVAEEDRPVLGRERDGGATGPTAPSGVIGADGAPRRVRFDGATPLIAVHPAGPPPRWASGASTAPGAAGTTSALAGVDGALSHDVRGALRGVNSFLELVDRSGVAGADEKAARFLGIARGAGADADLMVERLVHLLRIRDRPLVVEEVDLGEVVRRATTPEPEGPSIDVVAGELPTVVGDPTLLAEMLGELIGNSARFGATRVEVVALPAGGDGWARLAVTDDGPGVAPELAESAFGLFRQLQPKGQVPGVGMGLPVARAIAEVHAGALALGPAPGPAGSGTCARLRLAGRPRSGRVAP